ncbi:AT-rich interactive domain-containing protein 3A [Xyrichtys novacula]|uniref:AT-rich interactive domain-containing protein 3 n=1 Tax=Xyrichtys novacula TaxID=13765 RepID=A0AAV1G7K1_XYRNO|nr:AT-rich interactive domain-containing protein 3A [Xyrichtys novacula]
MVDHTSVSAKSALSASFSSSSLPLPAPPAPPGSSHNSFPGSQNQQAGGGMKLEAVMENLQRQQAARIALEEKLRQAEAEKELRSMVESQIQQQALAFRHYQAAMRGALTGGGNASAPGLSLPLLDVRRPAEDRSGSRLDQEERGEVGDEPDEQEVLDEEEEEEEEEEDVDLNHFTPRQPPMQGAPLHLLTRVPSAIPQTRRAESPNSINQSQNQHHEWTYEEQFKQLYELDDDEKRKEFLDDLFSFMQKRGTPVNRIPIMAKQVLDLYTLYKLVTEKGGLVEVINKKIWREITKGLRLPTSITSAAFTLRTQYMKYLYPYECEKRGLSSPGELQAAIDSNRREGRRQSYGSAIFNYSPVGTPTLLSSPKLHLSHLSMPHHNSNHIAQVPVIKKEEPMMSGCLPGRVTLPVSPGDHRAAAAAQAAAAVQAAALEQLREKLEGGEPPQKKMMMMEEQQRLMQHALQQNLLAMASTLPLNIKVHNRDDRQEAALNLSTSGISSINMSIEINGVVYTGVLFSGQAAMMGHRGRHGSFHTQEKSSPSQFQPSSSSSSSSSSLHGHRNSSP